MQRFVDTFSYADGPLSVVSGGLYVKLNNVADQVGVVSQQAAGMGAAENIVMLTSWTSLTAQWAEITLGNLLPYTGPTVFNTQPGSCYLVDGNNAGGHYNCYRMVDNNYTQLDGIPMAVPAVAGDVLRLEANLDIYNRVSLTMRLNGLVVKTLLDSDTARLTGGGAPGLRLFNTGVRVTRFAAGDLDDSSGGGGGTGGGGGDSRTQIGGTF